MIEIPNRGKKSIGVDLTTPGGREVVLEIAKSCDAFVTSYLPSRRRRFGIDVDDVRAVNPAIIYARGSGYGPRGDDADRPGYDGVSYWSRGGVGKALTPGDTTPIRQRPAFGDLLGGMAIAGGIAAALYKRKVTGETSVVDVSLLGLAAFNLSPDVTSSKLYADQPLPTFTHSDAPNPLVGDYRTKDGRYITLMMLQSDRFFPEAMSLVGLPDLVSDKRFVDAASRYANRAELIRLLDEVFAERTLSEWTQVLGPLSGAWGVVRAPHELSSDPAVVANGYIPTAATMSGSPYELAVNPVQFDEQHIVPAGAPEHGQHTEEVLLDADIDWDRIALYKQQGAVL
jgi:crotonobetainyl-CoA:carnitine CoA-transferase CaiB-like acyl-CoA transferase